MGRGASRECDFGSSALLTSLSRRLCVVCAASSPAGSDRNSMDSVDGCCDLRKTDSFPNAQAGSSPKKVDLIIWEIEVPKVRAAGVLGLGGGAVSQKQPPSEPEAEGRRERHALPRFRELPVGWNSLSRPQEGPVRVRFRLTGCSSPWGCPVFSGARVPSEMPTKARPRTWARQESLVLCSGSPAQSR